MKIRRTGPLFIALSLGGISPVLADCCSSVWDCAAAVVTDGLSCEVETIISTIKNLLALVKNLGDDVTGQTQNAQQAARQFVSDTINTMQAQTQQDSANLASALTQAQLLYKEETAPRDIRSTVVNNEQALQAAGPTTPSAPPSRAPLSELASQRAANAPVSAPNSSPPGNSLQRSTVTAGQTAVSVESQLAPHGSYADAFARGVKQITALKGAGDTDATQVNQYIAAAQHSEGPGVAAANTLAGAINAPLNGIEAQLTSMLSNPLKAFDPSSTVDSIEDSVKANLSVNIAQMIDDITSGPKQAFNSATPFGDDLFSKAELAQATAAAMDKLYRFRTPAAADALYALLPKQDYAGLTSKATATGTLNGNVAARLSASTIAPKFSSFRQKALLAVKQPNLDSIHAAVAQFKAQRAQGKTAQSASMVQTYRTNLSKQFDVYFAGKSPAAVATQRDQLIAQARTRFATDPTTQNGVIGLINSEAAKRGSTANATLPGQRAPTASSPTAPITGPAAAMTAPAAAMTSIKPQIGLAPAAAAPNVPAAPAKPAAWGTAPPAWTPPAASASAMTTAAPLAPHAVTPVTPPAVTAAAALKPTPVVKTIQPVQHPPQQPSAVHTTPSSLTAPPAEPIGR